MLKRRYYNIVVAYLALPTLRVGTTRVHSRSRGQEFQQMSFSCIHLMFRINNKQSRETQFRALQFWIVSTQLNVDK